MSQFGGVHPAYRGQGIGGKLLDWAEIAAVPLHVERYPGLPLSLSGWCPAGDSGASSLYTSRGYRTARWFHVMAADLTAAGPGAPVPAGVQVLRFTGELAEEARLVRNEAFSDHGPTDQVTPGEWAYFLSYNAFRSAFSYLAYDGTEPIGVLIGREYDAYTELTGILDLYIAEVATRRSARNRGIASALLSRALADAPLRGLHRRVAHRQRRHAYCWLRPLRAGRLRHQSDLHHAGQGPGRPLGHRPAGPAPVVSMRRPS